MSSAAGFNHYNRAGMARAEMEDRQRSFGFKSLFDGFYHLYHSLEQQWAYYARHIDFMLREPASRPYLGLRSLVGLKDYFILSTNVDAQVEKTFPAGRVCNYQGSFARLQCKQPCCDELFDAGPYVKYMIAGMAGSRFAARTSPDARTAAGSLCRGCATTRFPPRRPYGPQRVRNRNKRWEALSDSPGSIGPFSSDRFAREVEQAVAVVPVLSPAYLDFGRDTVGERFR